ncbi:MAG: glucosamine-6-phosphate deaminase [Candidatus Helarchaeota archaeon]
MAEFSNFKLIITENYRELGKEAAKIVAEVIKQKPNCVLGLPTGSTPISMYDELIRMHVEEGLDFSQVVTFNLDEYYPIKKKNPQSYNYYMNYWFFKHVNIKPENINIPNGEIPEDKVEEYCMEYEKKIKDVGGIDLQVLGIGRYSGYKDGELLGGHIGFNESGSDPNSRTRKVKLSSKTRLDNSRFFKSLNEVPRYSITMGIATILEARKILLLASGEHKADIMKAMIDGGVTEKIPASYLKFHDDFTIILDKSAAEKLERFKKPWLAASVKKIDWNDPVLIQKAVVWLASQTNKSLNELTEEDFINNGLRYLLTHHGDVKKINDLAIKQLKNKIIDEKNCPKNKKIVIISPHPDDDVICVGATLHFLNKHDDVRIIYVTSGSKSVKDEDLFDFYKNETDLLKLLEKKTSPVDALTEEEIEKIDLLRRKLREQEAMNAVDVLGVQSKQLIFLDSPFYHKRLFIDGKVRKSEITDDDISGLCKILKELKPEIIIVNGEHEDPHGTHGKTLQIFETASQKMSFEFETWYYKGAWEEFSLDEVSKIFSFDKYLMDLKVSAIKTHKSQIDALYLGEDQRAFWMRALERNENTGKQLNKLGILNKDLYCEVFKIKNP